MKIAIVGATGEVGRMMIRNLVEFEVPVSQLDLYASKRSAGSTLYYMDSAIQVMELTAAAWDKSYDYILFSAGSGIAKAQAPEATKACQLVIDNSSAFRKDEGIPLVVPEINGSLLKGYKGIVANPNCSTIQMVLPLAVLDKLFGLRKVVVSTYQSVSGSGHKGLATLQAQREGSDDLGDYPAVIDLNLIPQIGAWLDDGYCAEEEKMHSETCKILANEKIHVCATTVRVPVMYGHSISVYAEFEQKVVLALAEEKLSQAEAISFSANTFTTPLDLGSSNESHVSRLRHGGDDYSLAFWNVAHNIRLGAATNAVKIMLKHAGYEV